MSSSVREITDAEAAWLAGIFDGEGTLYHNARQSTWNLSVGMSDFDVIQRLQVTTGIGHLRTPKVRPGRKPMLLWRVNLRAEINTLTTLMYPWLSARRQGKIDEFREWLKTASPGRGGRGKDDRCWQGHVKPTPGTCRVCAGRVPYEPVTECRHGHEYTPENTRIGPDGTRYCRSCVRENSRARYRADPKAANAARTERKRRARSSA